VPLHLVGVKIPVGSGRIPLLATDEVHNMVEAQVEAGKEGSGWAAPSLPRHDARRGRDDRLLSTRTCMGSGQSSA
jgi:hypothetical protein